MAYQVLARKWRPKTFKEMVGQEHVLRALINALDEDRLHHAYLFTGTRGVGKTTIARIIAKSLNCEQGVSATPCGVCSTCQEVDEGRFVDLIEVDAASRTKVEDTRELLENVQYAPTRGRYKVYLIDEVHMLSTSSFNALLKTLEEPPAHVKFLLATTDPQKLPATVLSRCLQFNLKRMPMDQIIAHHKHILTQEQIEFEDTALSLIARAADGSMRDSLSLLDQSIAFGHGKVMQADVASMLGSISYDFIAHIIQALSAKDGNALMTVVEKLSERAPDFLLVLNELVTILHQLALIKRIPDAVDESLMDKAQLLALAEGLSEADIQLLYQIGLMGKRDLPLAPNARTGFEMVLLRMLAFTPNAEGSTPMPLAGSNGSAPVKKPEAQQVNASHAVVQNTVADVNENQPAEYTTTTETSNTSVDETVDAVQHASDEPSPEEVPEQRATQNTHQDVPPQHGVEAQVQDAPQPDVIQGVTSEPVPAPVTPEAIVGSTVESSAEMNAAAPVTTVNDVDTVQPNSVNNIVEPELPQAHESEKGQPDQPSTQSIGGQSRVSRRAQLRAQRHQGEHTALPKMAALVEPTRDDQNAVTADPAETHIKTPTTQPAVHVTPDESLTVQGASTHVSDVKEVESKDVIQPTVELPAEPLQPPVETSASDAFTPEELAVYEEYAGMTDDDEMIGYDLALDNMQPRQVAEPSVSVPPQSQPEPQAQFQPQTVEPVLAETVQKKSPKIPAPEQSVADKRSEIESVAQGASSSSTPSPKTDDATQQVWFELLERVNVDGLSRQLAENCALRSRVKKGESYNGQPAEHARIELVLHSAHDTLLNDASKYALQTALSDYLGTPHELNITVGDTADISETPAERKTRLFGERHNHAIEAILQDPNVLMMQSMFGATVDATLIKPIELNA